MDARASRFRADTVLKACLAMINQILMLDKDGKNKRDGL